MNDICVIASSPSALSGIHRAATRWLMAVGLAGFALVVGAVVPTPTITGPLAGDVPGTVPGHNYPFFATHIVMADYGYVEQEFYMDGTATNFGNPNGTANASIVSTGNPYRTRMLVRRPVDPAKFNGTVIVEWFNVTNGWDLDVFWQEQMAYYIREGYVWIGVTAQNASVTNATTGLKVWSPTRYGTMNLNNSGTVGNDQLGYDVFSQAAQAVRKVPIVLGGLTPQTVIGAGESQSAGRVHTYVNSIHILDPVYDGFIVAHGNGTTRPEVTVPFMRMLSEQETMSIPNIQADTSKVRTWAVAGSTHSEYYTMILRAPILLRDLNQQAFDTCATPARSRVTFYMAMNAATDALVKWIRTGVEPAHSPPQQVSGTPVRLTRDARGNSLGGIILPEMAVPVAKNAADACGLGGSHVMFDTPTLNTLYPTQADYVSKVTNAANASVAAGFMLPYDSKLTKTHAMTSIYGLGLDCGYLCVDQDAFPIHPSASLLRDQTELLHYVGSQTPTNRVILAQRAIAIGYTLGTTNAAARAKFAEAIGILQLYINDIQGIQSTGHLKPETATLLVAQATTLIQRLSVL